MFHKMGVTPPIIQVMDDHDVVLKPMMTWGSPTLRNHQNSVMMNWWMLKNMLMTVNELSYVVLSDWLATILASVSAVKSISAVYIYIYTERDAVRSPFFHVSGNAVFLHVFATSCSILYVHIPVMVLLEIHTDCQTSSGLAKGCQRMSRESWRFPGKRKEEKQT